MHDRRFFGRVLASGTLGFEESYMDGWWDCDALDEVCCRAIGACRGREAFRISISKCLSIASARLLASATDYIDLDGPLLLACDREHSFSYKNGWISLPSPQPWA